jgi:hypothetical protein
VYGVSQRVAPKSRPRTHGKFPRHGHTNISLQQYSIAHVIGGKEVKRPFPFAASGLRVMHDKR